MPDPTTERLAALLEKEYGCKPGQVHEGYGAECASSAHAPTLYRTFGCDHAAHVAAILAEAGVGFVAGAERERAEARATNDRLNRRVQIAEAAVHELTTGTGNGKARPVAAEMWARCQETHERHCPRAERAEAALADLRARVKALADEWDQRAERAERGQFNRRERWAPALRKRADEIRALLDTEATP